MSTHTQPSPPTEADPDALCGASTRSIRHEPPNKDTLRWCQDGHCWIDHGDSTISPAWDLSATHVPVADTRRCPELLLDQPDRRNTRRHPSSVRTTSGNESVDDAQTCGGYAVGAGHRWVDRTWPLPEHDGWRLWWIVCEAQPPRLVWLIGELGARWRSTFDVIDLHSGERFDIDGHDMTVAWEISKAQLSSLPPAMLADWPRRGDRPVPPQFDATPARTPDLRWLVTRIGGERPAMQLALALDRRQQPGSVPGHVPR